jgi:uncharacterized protein (TIGR02466 family)
MSINFKSKAQLWFPTTIFQVTLDDVSKKIINDEIMMEIKDHLNNPESKKSTYVNTDTNLHKSKKLKQASAFFNRAIFEYLKFLKIEHHDFEISGCWANISRKNFSHHNHSHQNNFVSGVYYCKTDKGKSDKIHFNDPREQNKVIIPVPSEQNIYNSNGALLDATEGVAYLFPSWLRHEVPIHKSEEDRISVAFNAMFTDLESLSKPGFSAAIRE